MNLRLWIVLQGAKLVFIFRSKVVHVSSFLLIFIVLACEYEYWWLWLITYCGCVLYTVPSTPTVILNVLKFRLCLIRVKMAASPAATRFEDLKDTMVLICWTAMQSSGDGVKLSSVRMSLVFFRPFLYLRKMDIYVSYCFQTEEVWHGKKKITYSSMAATWAVVIFPLVLRALDTHPSNSSPSLAIFNTTSLTNSPRYIPLTIFSKLEQDKKYGNRETAGMKADTLMLFHIMTKKSSCFSYSCFPGLLEVASTSLSNSVM